LKGYLKQPELSKLNYNPSPQNYLVSPSTALPLSVKAKVGATQLGGLSMQLFDTFHRQRNLLQAPLVLHIPHLESALPWVVSLPEHHSLQLFDPT
jgi:hypothetical protein